MTARFKTIWLFGLPMLMLAGGSTPSLAKVGPPPPTTQRLTAPEPPALAWAEAEPREETSAKPEPVRPPVTLVAQAPREPAPAPPGAAAPEPTPAPQAPPRPPASQRAPLVVFNFDNADIDVVIQAASKVLGFNYVLEPKVKGRKVTVETSGRIAQDELFNLLLAVLEVHGVTAIKSGNLYKIVQIEGARQRPVPTIIGPDPEPRRRGDEVITQIVPLRFATVTELIALLQPLISARGNLTAHRETNLLLITDTAANARRILEIVKLVDKPVALAELQVIPVKFADAEEIANILNQLFAPGRIRAPAPPRAAPVPPPRPRARPRRPRRAPAPAPTSEQPPFVTAYRGSNVLIVQARKPQIETIRQLIAKLDVDIYAGRQVFIYFAENAKAGELTVTMNAIYGGADGAQPSRGPTPPPGGPTPPPPPPRSPRAPGTAERRPTEGELRFIADETTNAVIVTTFPRNWPEIEETLKKLDRMPRQVLIEVLVAEVSLTEDISLGIEWAIRSGRFDLFSAPEGTLSGRPSFAIPPAVTSAVAPGLTFFTFETNRFFTLLNALAQDNKLNILSSPSITTSENKKAVFNVSDSVPIATAQQTPIGAEGVPTETITQNIEYRDVGIILTVMPRIGEQGTVALDVKQEVNEIGARDEATLAPTFIKREAETSVVLLDNQTLVMGGLIETRRAFSRVGIPLLSKIPLLGLLFSTTTKTVEKTELLILITPRVIGTPQDAARITEEMKRISPELNKAIQTAPRPPPPSEESPPASPRTAPESHSAP
ncbi:MAG: type II secretion system secretin GspD [Candidatus Methylomirabilia bacterium]